MSERVRPAWISGTEGPLDHEWTSAFGGHLGTPVIGDGIAARFRPIHPMGVFTLATGFASWIAWRLQDVAARAMLLDYIDAVRAEMFGGCELIPRKEVPGAPHLLADWSGPQRGPVIFACNSLDGLRRGLAKGGSGAHSVAELGAAVGMRGFLPKPAAYRKWRTAIMQRLLDEHPRESRSKTPVPIEALDPAFAYKARQAPKLIASYVAAIDRANPFIRPAA